MDKLELYAAVSFVKTWFFVLYIVMEYLATSDTVCNETDIRLVDGPSPHEGQVEVCQYGIWGSVCNDKWDIRDAQVVCQQLGYDECELNL